MMTQHAVRRRSRNYRRTLLHVDESFDMPRTQNFRLGEDKEQGDDVCECGPIILFILLLFLVVVVVAIVVVVIPTFAFTTAATATYNRCSCYSTAF